jgi:hypothetical protein
LVASLVVMPLEAGPVVDLQVEVVIIRDIWSHAYLYKDLRALEHWWNTISASLGAACRSSGAKFEKSYSGLVRTDIRMKVTAWKNLNGPYPPTGDFCARA